MKIAGPSAVRSLINKGMHLPIEQNKGLSQNDKENDPKCSKCTEEEFNADIKGSGTSIPGTEDNIQGKNNCEGTLLL
jgi:hypothetical protein